MKKIVSMHMKVWLVALALCATVQSKETTLRIKDNGVLGAIHREGCRSSWLSSVSVQGERAEWVNFRELAKGLRIDIPDTCGEKAPDSVARHSRFLIARESKLLSVDKLRTERNSLAEHLKNKEKESSDAKARINDLGKKVVDLATQLEIAKNTAQAASSAASNKARNWKWLIAICCIEGVLLVLLGIWASSLRRERVDLRQQVDWLEEEKRKGKTEVEGISDPMGPETYIATIGDKEVVFRAIHHAKCPYCSEDRLTPRSNNLRQHIEKVHPEKIETAEAFVEEAKSA